VLCYSGFYGTGVKEIWDMIYEYIDFVKANGYFDHRRNDQAKYWMYESINEHLKSSFYNNKVVQAQLQQAEQMVLGGQQTSFVAAQNLLDRYFEELRHDHRD
jgi:LAO/AO transport system kinase